jgi:prepilin-type N-terminal cleavage/methylation domain-containing protein
MRKREAGFTLIEIIATLVIVGTLSVFAAMFMSTFVKGYSATKTNTETAMKAQMALDRLSVELKDATAISALTANSFITYSNALGTNRTIRFVAPNISLATPTNQTLIDRIQTFTLNATYNNVYNIAANDVAFIDIGFTVNGVGTFGTRIFPRERIPHP